MRAYAEGKIQDWIAAVGLMTQIAWKEPQAAFSGLTRSLQGEWTFLQRVLPGVDCYFAPLAEAIRDHFIPALFGFTGLPSWTKTIASLPIRWSGIGLRSPEVWAADAFHTSLHCTKHLQDSLLDNREGFSLSAHKDSMAAGKKARERRVDLTCERARELVMEDFQLNEGLKRALDRGKDTGSWLAAVPLHKDGTALSALEFRDGLALHFQHEPIHLPPQCDGCGMRATLDHVLNCHKGGAVIMRHNEIRDALGQLSATAFTPSAVRSEPLINPGSAAEVVNNVEGPDGTSVERDSFAFGGSNERGDVLVRGLWAPQTDCVIDVRVTDSDSCSQRHMDVPKVLLKHERAKKSQYLLPCLEQRRHFSPFVCSVDGVLGREATAVLRRLGRAIAPKWDMPFSKVMAYIKTQISLAILRAAHHCIRGSRIPAKAMSIGTGPFEDGAGLLLNRQHTF